MTVPHGSPPDVEIECIVLNKKERIFTNFITTAFQIIDKLNFILYHQYVVVLFHMKPVICVDAREESPVKTGMKTGGRRLVSMWLAALLCLLPCLAGAEDYIVEEDGSKWYADGHIEWADGSVTNSVDHDRGQTQDEDSSSTSQNADGSITVDTGEADPMAGKEKNADGSITVESGEGGVDIQVEPTQAPLTPEEFAQRLEHAAEVNGGETLTIYTDPETGDHHVVDVAYMGIGRSRIILDGTPMMVNTVDLQWETEAPEDQLLAVIDTPKYGFAAMHAGKSKKTTLIMQCRLDKVVRVIVPGKTWTLVDYDGTRGYVQTASLEFFANDHVDFEQGLVSIKGRIKGKDTVNVRSRDDTHRYLDPNAPVTVGTPVTVFDIIDEWAEVDINGWHCLINSNYLTLEQDTVVASATGQT